MADTLTTPQALATAARQIAARRPPAARPRPRRGSPATVLRSAAVLTVLFGLWELAPRLGWVERSLIPPVSEVARAWWALAADGQLLDNTRASLTRAFTGFGIAVLVGVPLGVLLGWYKVVHQLLDPVLQLFRNTAALALLPVFTLLLGIGETSKIAIVVYACLFPVVLNTISGVGTVDPLLLKSARSMALPPLQLFRKVVLPSAVPSIFTGVRLAGASSILVLIAAEMVGAKAGLGYLINSSQFNFMIPQMYAGILTISAIGLVVNGLLVGLERRFSRWRTDVRS
ncbi:ABC transporter permease [Kineococcus sp. NUM-3379]